MILKYLFSFYFNRIFLSHPFVWDECIDTSYEVGKAVPVPLYTLHPPTWHDGARSSPTRTLHSYSRSFHLVPPN